MTNDHAIGTKKNWRRLFQFRLRTLLVLMMLGGPTVGHLGPPAYEMITNAINPPPPASDDIRNVHFFVAMSR